MPRPKISLERLERMLKIAEKLTHEVKDLNSEIAIITAHMQEQLDQYRTLVATQELG